MIPYGRQEIDKSDIDSVVKVLQSDFLTQGPVVPLFEEEVANYCGANHAVAVNSATSALHIACLGLGLGPGDWLWTSAITFLASANCGLYCGAHVDFVDVDPHTYNISVAHLAEKLAQAEKVGKLPKVVVPVHLCGQSCDMAGIHALSEKYGFKIIEDASHAIGGKYKDNQIGNCHFSDVTVFSFHPVKIITTGEGGVAVTNDQEILDRMRRYRNHGITTDPNETRDRPIEEIWNYQQICLGYNYRMTDIQAALGVSQIKRLDKYVERRHIIADRYNCELRDLPVQTPWQHPDSYSSYHLYPVRLKLGELQPTQQQVYDNLIASGINVNLHYIPVYRQPYYEALGFKANYCSEAERYFKEVISIPMYPALTDGQVDAVVKAIRLSLFRKWG